MTPDRRTERLLMRRWRDEDLDPFAEMCADPEVMRHFPSTLAPSQSEEMVGSMMAAWTRRGFGLWAVERIDTGSFIGFIGLSSPSWSTKTFLQLLVFDAAVYFAFSASCVLPCLPAS